MSALLDVLAPGLGYVDLLFQRAPRIIATAVLQGGDGPALVDPGPTSCLATLRAALDRSGSPVADLRAILLTHIHLDHAGATGSLVGENPRLKVYVHERGARHLIDPTRLLDSARRLYGDAMESLWGEVLAVPAENVESLSGGERLTVAGRDYAVAYTPGHASHHVSYLERATGIAFVGDTAGVRIGPSEYVLPPTPPPDIDLDAWRASVAAIAAWQPRALFVTHFGLYTGVANHLQTFLATLDELAEVARATLAEEGTDAARASRYRDYVGRHLRRHLPEPEASLYGRAAPFEQSWLGLARYWRKRLDLP